MIYISLLIFVLLTILLNQLKWYNLYNFHSNIKKIDINYENLNTGDIITFYKDYSLFYKGHNNINITPNFFNNILKTYLYTFQGNFSHFGIILKINEIPYLLHLTSSPQYDLITHKWVLGKTSLVNISEMTHYFGYSYVYKYNGPPLYFNNDIFNHTLYLNGNWLDIILMKIYEPNWGVCINQVLYIMKKLNILNNNFDTLQFVSIKDFINIIHSHKYYSDTPSLLINGYYSTIQLN